MAARILIVEDDPDIALLVTRYLTKAGFTTEHVASGRAALTSVAARIPDAVVLDLMLPQVDGLEICRIARANDATAGIPIIMLTARAEESDRIVGLELGADDYLAKPFSPNELVARVRALLRRAKRSAPAQGRTTTYGPIVVDSGQHTVSVADTQASPASWGLDRIDQTALPLSGSYSYPSSASTVHAYIIDTGIRFTHQTFGGRAVKIGRAHV